MVAMAFLGAAWVISNELARKEQQGLLHPEVQTIEVGKASTIQDLLISAIIGFVLGFKIGGIFGHLATVSPDPMGYFLSSNGNMAAGIAGALALGIYKYFEKKKEVLPEPQMKKVLVRSQDLVTEIVVVAAIGGLIGAKIFNAMETWDDFIKDPIRSLTSSSGLTFLGGLIMATILLYFYSRKKGMPFKHLCDAAAPGIMLAYGIGRLGCHFSGDGDWGIFNSAYVSNPDGTLRAATAADSQYITQMTAGTPYVSVPAPAGIPRWLVGMNYPHNVGHEGMSIQGCTGDYCSVLPVSVFPTSIYEAVACILLFFLLWSLRKRFTRALQMFGTYLILVGVERFLIELMRVNYKYDWGFVHPSQAEILSVALILIGSCLLLFYKDKKEPTMNNSTG